MGREKKIMQWYLRVSRAFFLFPLSRSKSGALKFAVCSFPTFLSITLAGFFPAVMLLTFIYSSVNEEPLSYLITVVPSILLSVFSNSVIRVSSTCYTSDLLQFLSPLRVSWERHNWQNTKIFSMLILLPLVYAVALIIGYIAIVAFGVQYHFSLAASDVESVWDGLLFPPFIHTTFLFCRDGPLFCAVLFISLFGQEVMKRFEMLCAEVIDVEGFISVKELSEKFAAVKTDFEIYSKIGGAFSFALVLHIGTLEFFSVSGVLFHINKSLQSFRYMMRVFESIFAALILLTIAEVGNQMESKVK